MDAWDFSCSWMSAPSLLFHPITLSNPILMRDLFWGWGCSFSCVFINELHAHHSLWGKLLYITDWLKTFVIFFCCLAFPLFLAVSYIIFGTAEALWNTCLNVRKTSSKFIENMAVFTHLHSLQIEVQLEKKKLSRERMCYLTPLHSKWENWCFKLEIFFM